MGEEGEGLKEAKTVVLVTGMIHPRGFTDPASYIDLAGISSDQLGKVTTSPSLHPHSTTSFALAMEVNLHFSFDVESHAVDTNIFFVSVNTPTKTHGLGAGKTADLTYARGGAKNLNKGQRAK
ncbi:UDP-glucose 6-dehydrogenase 4 [Acorus calamus]|uniref:UDP-glucose 6-dehydrogenase 4 n=1 Tax=Acorus calamus TaxID=4465 RepID=A0AAV9ELA7_ACOCL|nr:UDP-glucose 6-dehydrogenase 4 [Acorus calamus]